MTGSQLMTSGAITVTALLIALFFLRFWRQGRDPFFLYFAVAFLLQGAARLAPLVTVLQAHEQVLYVSRLLSYLLIVLAIWSKNRARTRPGRPTGGAKHR